MPRRRDEPPSMVRLLSRSARASAMAPASCSPWPDRPSSSAMAESRRTGMTSSENSGRESGLQIVEQRNAEALRIDIVQRRHLDRAVGENRGAGAHHLLDLVGAQAAFLVEMRGLERKIDRTPGYVALDARSVDIAGRS